MRILSNLRWWSVLYACLAPFNLLAAGITFEPNLGQTGVDIRYLARTSSGVIFITDRGITLSEPLHTVPAFELLNASLSAEWTPQSATGETISYFIGRDPSKWIRDAPHYERLVHRRVYPGIDLVLYGAGQQLEYDFLLAPYADPSQIRLKLTGAKTVSVAADGALIVNTPDGEMRHRKPVLMETLPNGSRRSVSGAFRVLGRDEVGFSVERHDPALELSIDPVLESSTYFGGSADDQVIASDGNGSLAGMTTSIDAPDASLLRRKGTDMFVKVANQMFVLGGSGNETVTSAVFSLLPYSGGLIAAVAGYTNSTDLPTNISSLFGQPSALQPNYAGGATDGFLLLINSGPNGVGVPQLTYIGGPGDDRINAIATEPYGSALVLGGDTNGGGLPLSPYIVNAPPTALASGLDGFVILAYPDLNEPLYLYSTTYIGGSGDDTISGVSIANSIIYATGETKSHDFPLKNALYAKLNGESDAFVARFDSGGALSASSLLGGSGADRGVALHVLFNGNVVVAGVTSSTDLPLVNPKQKAYGGGASDAFVAQFNGDLSKLIESTYLGGSEADEATSVAVAFPNTIFVGGWTASQNFPTVNALQSKYGGGADDGFLVHFDDDGTIYQSTYFGGSGSDRVLGLTGDSLGGYYGAYTGPTVWLLGVTTSSDFPLKNASQTSLRGSSDGFVAEVTANLFSFAPFTGGKDLRSALQLYYGNSALASQTVFTITSSDPSMVQLSASQTGPGQTSIQFVPQPGPTRVYADCLTDSGSAKLTATAAGYATRVVQATCVPQAIVVQPPSGSSLQIQTNVGAGASTIGLYQVANDPKSGPLYGAFTRPGAAPVIVQIADSNPAVGTVSPASVTLPVTGNQNPIFQPVAIGQTDLTFSAGDLTFLPSNKMHATVGGSVIAPERFSVPSGFQVSPQLSFVSRPGVVIVPTITSKDPTRVALSLDQTKPGKASVTLTGVNFGNQSFFVQALGSSGDVPLIISVPGEPDITTTVHITTAVAVLTYGFPGFPTLQKLPVGGTASVGFNIYAADLAYYGQLFLNPGRPPITFNLQASKSGVVKITPGSTQLTSISGGNFQVTGESLGSTTLTLTNSAKIPVAGISKSVPVNVVKTVLAFPDIEVGKDLTDRMSVTLPDRAPADVVITATVNDPTLALLSLDGNTTGQPQIITVIPSGQSVAQFYVQALKASGQAKVTATASGFESVTADVNLDQSGFYWSTENFGYNSNQGVSPGLLSGPLDAASLIPVNSQGLRPGVTAVPGITSSNPNVATFDPYSSQIAAKSAGTTTLTIQQPAGFKTPSVRQKLTITVPQPTLPAYSFSLGKYTQAPLDIPVPKLTVTSSDPKKVLLSTDPAKLGSASVSAVNKQIYVQALAASGTVTLTVSSPGYQNASGTVSLVPTGLSISLLDYTGATTFKDGKYSTSTQSQAIGVGVYLRSNAQTPGGVTFLPGLPSFTANITSTNPGVAVITGSPVTINPATMSYGQPLATATLLQVAPGETTIGISQPAGYLPAGNDQIILDVVVPSLPINGFIVAKDTVTQNSIYLPQGVKPVGASTLVTLTSTDPSRILLAPDASTTPSSSIMIPFQNGSQASFYIHALSDNGLVPIKTTTPGFADGSFTMQLAPLAFIFSNSSDVPIRAVIQGGPVQNGVTAAVIAPSSTSSVAGVSMLRPGVPDIIVGVSSSDPSIVSVSPKQFVFQGNTLQGPVTFTPLKPGTATIRLTVPRGYATSAQSKLSILADEANISFYNSSGLQVGHDLQAGIGFSIEDPRPDLPVTVTSSNPALLLVAPDSTSPGQHSVVLPFASQNSNVYVQALAGSGKATVFFAAPGYHTATFPVTLTPAGATFGPYSYNQPKQNLLTSAGVQQLSISLSVLDPVSLTPLAAQALRPGATLSVGVTSSNPKVVAVTTPTVHFSPQPQNSPAAATVSIQPVGAGSAVVTLGALSGNPAPTTATELIFNVTEAALSIPAFSLGRDLQAPVQITLGSSVATPTTDLPLTVSTGSYYIAVAANATNPGVHSLSVTIPAGQRVSRPFYVQGLQTGTDTLNYGGGAFQNLSTPVTVTQTAFVFQEALNGQGLNINAGASAKLTVVPALSPLSGAAPGPLSVHSGVNPVVIAVASTNPNAATTSPAQVTFNPGDTQAVVTVQGLSAGTATVKLLGTNYDFGQPPSSIAVVVK